MVIDLMLVPLSLSDHYLIKCNLTVDLPPHVGQRPIKMVHPCRLLDPVGFQDLIGTPVKALVDEWYAVAPWAADMITPKHSLHY